MGEAFSATGLYAKNLPQLPKMVPKIIPSKYLKYDQKFSVLLTGLFLSFFQDLFMFGKCTTGVVGREQALSIAIGSRMSGGRNHPL